MKLLQDKLVCWYINLRITLIDKINKQTVKTEKGGNMPKLGWYVSFYFWGESVYYKWVNLKLPIFQLEATGGEENKPKHMSNQLQKNTTTCISKLHIALAANAPSTIHLDKKSMQHFSPVCDAQQG